jgi:hypothetical protein
MVHGLEGLLSIELALGFVSGQINDSLARNDNELTASQRSSIKTSIQISVFMPLPSDMERKL